MKNLFAILFFCVPFLVESQNKVRIIQAKDIPLTNQKSIKKNKDTLVQNTQKLQEKVLDSTILNAHNDTLLISKDVVIEDGYTDETQLIEIDKKWINELYDSKLYHPDDANFSDYIPEYSELDTDVLKSRLKEIDQKTPFHIEYNASLEAIIKRYLKTRRKSLSNLIEKSHYYFPLFEQELAKYNIPDELKYLAIVESALNPRAKSRVGATGLWQFMYQTGVQFNLNVSSYIDERQDPIKSTKAACEYLSKLYDTFGDWDLALAAYNSGPGNVSKAIRRSNGKRNYWNIRHNLPRETAGYVPAFYATLYIFEYAKEHNLKSLKKPLYKFETDSVHVKALITFDQISEKLSISKEELQFLNPQYKLDIIPFITKKENYLVLPKSKIGMFVSNEAAFYSFVNEQNSKREKPLPENVIEKSKIRYTVRKGDFLGKISKRYSVSVSQIKRWNNMRSNNLRIGQRLTIYPRKSNTKKSNKQNSTVSIKKVLNKPHTKYTVRKGDSLWSIAQNFSKVSPDQIKVWNSIGKAKGLKPGMVLKIYKL